MLGAIASLGMRSRTDNVAQISLAQQSLSADVGVAASPQLEWNVMPYKLKESYFGVRKK